MQQLEHSEANIGQKLMEAGGVGVMIAVGSIEAGQPSFKN